MNRFSLLVATMFGSGYFPVASGTAGTVVAFVIMWFLNVPQETVPDRIMMLVLALIVYLLGIRVLDRAEEYFGEKDPSPVVIDEVAGSIVTLFMVPHTITGYIVAFLAFRLMDIIKPFPAGQAESLNGGLGIMTDDIIAGVYACIVANVIIMFL